MWGWDLGRHQSWTAGIALDRDGQVCRIQHFQQDWPRTIKRVVSATEPAVALVDATHGSVGDPILPFLRAGAEDGRFISFEFTSKSREALFDGLVVAIQGQVVALPTEGGLRSELEALEWQETSRSDLRYGFPHGISGDLVIGLALAVRQFKKASAELLSWGGGSSVDVQRKSFEERVKERGGVYFPNDGPI